MLKAHHLDSSTSQKGSLLTLSYVHVRYFHEFALLGFFTFYPLNSAVSGSAVVALGKRGFSALLALTLLHVLIYEKKTRDSRRMQGSIPTAALFSYASILLISTITNQRPFGDYFEYATIPLSIGALCVCERFQRGSFLRFLILASCIHLILAAALNERSLGTSGVYRLGGWSHPINLGVEAAFLLVFGVSLLLNDKRSVTGLVLTAGGLYILVQALSKTAILGAALGVGLQLIFFARRGKQVRAGLVLGALVIVAAIAHGWVAEVLIGESGLESIETGTGRTEIWGHIAEHFDEYWQYGYGWAPLHKTGGRDTELLTQTNGLPAENAFIASLLMGGVFALALFITIFISALIRSIYLAEASFGFSLGMMCIILASCLFTESAAGLNYHWFWLLGTFSLSSYLRASG